MKNNYWNKVKNFIGVKKKETLEPYMPDRDMYDTFVKKRIERYTKPKTDMWESSEYKRDWKNNLSDFPTERILDTQKEIQKKIQEEKIYCPDCGFRIQKKSWSFCPGCGCSIDKKNTDVSGLVIGKSDKGLREEVIRRWDLLGLLDNIENRGKQIFSELDPYGEEDWNDN